MLTETGDLGLTRLVSDRSVRHTNEWGRHTTAHRSQDDWPKITRNGSKVAIQNMLRFTQSLRQVLRAAGSDAAAAGTFDFVFENLFLVVFSWFNLGEFRVELLIPQM